MNAKLIAQAEILGCTPKQVRNQLQKNARQLRAMEREAIAKGRKINGYTASDLNAMARSFEEKLAS